MSHMNLLAIVESAINDSPGQNVYFLLDQAGLPGVARELRKYSALQVKLFDDTKEQAAADVGPVLLLAAGNDTRLAVKGLFRWLDKYAGDAFSIIVMVSPLPFDAMRKRLSARLKIKLSEEMEAIFRFYDPRILASLISILSEPERDIFLGVASRWVYPNRSGGVDIINTRLQENDDFKEPFSISSQQEFKLLEASEVDQVLNLLRTIMPSKMAEFSVSEKYHLVKDLMCRAQTDGIESILGCAIFASIFIKGGSRVASSSLMQDVVKELRNTESDILKLNDLIDAVLLE